MSVMVCSCHTCVNLRVVFAPGFFHADTAVWQVSLCRPQAGHGMSLRGHSVFSEGRDPKCSHYPMKSAERSMSMREQQLAKQRMAVSRNHHILTFSEVFETSLTSWNSFNTLSHPSHTLLNMADRSKSTTAPTKSNAHVACQFKCHAHEAYTSCEYIHLVLLKSPAHGYITANSGC